MTTGLSKVRKKVKNSLHGNMNLEFLLKILFVEDDDLSRLNVLQPLENKNFQNILAPNTTDECSDKLQNYDFSHALIDFDLVEWVGRNDNNCIKANGDECCDGTDITIFLKNHRRLNEIVLFSKNEESLRRSYQNIQDKDGIILLPRKGDLATDLINYIKDYYKSKVVIKPLHKMTGELPKEIQLFYAKKLINSFKTGEYIWRAGEYAWQVGVNQELSDFYSETIKFNKFTSENPEEKFLLTISKDGLDLESIVDETFDLRIDFNDILGDSPAYESESLIHKYLITQALCKNYLDAEFNEINKIIAKLRLLGEDAMFESQKILFKELSQADSIGANNKEEIYDLLRDFTSKGFWQILDIYKGRVDSITNEIAHVKFQSFSPENSVRVDRFNPEFLSKHHILYEDAQFEYTIYKTSMGAGSAYHIEPI